MAASAVCAGHPQHRPGECQGPCGGIPIGSVSGPGVLARS
ncbi:hypothetical protein VB716_08610 [Synechococcus sp. CCY9201]|nr:hypothetical protein [Synechococcus sp. CCY9201]MEA5474281.1 hypothetical protein [Synechococcus sp. CCY9201]